MVEVMTMLENKAGCSDHRIGTLLPCQPRAFLNPKERIFASPPVNKKDRLLWRKIDRVILPLSIANFAAIEAEDLSQLVPVKRNNVCYTGLSGADPGGGLNEEVFAIPRGMRYGIFFSFLLLIHSCPPQG